MIAALTPPPLLRWQLLLLFAATGTLSPIYGRACIIVVFVLLLAARHKTFLPPFKAKHYGSRAFVFFYSRLLLPALAFCLGLLAAQQSFPNEYHAPDTILSKTPVNITATIDAIDALPGKRLRIILSEVEVTLPLPENPENLKDPENLEKAETAPLSALQNTSPKNRDGDGDGDVPPTQTPAQTPTQSASQSTEQIVGQTTGQATMQSTGQTAGQTSAQAQPLTATTRPATIKLPVKIAWTWQTPDYGIGQNIGQNISQNPSQSIEQGLLTGERIQTSLRLSSLHGLANFYSSGADESWPEKNIQLRAFSKNKGPDIIHLSPAPFLQKARAYVEKRLIAALQNKDGTLSKGNSLIFALLMGNRYFLTNVETNLFAAASLSHSLALSGLHLGFMVAIGAVVALAISSIFPRILLTLPRPKLIAICAAPLILAYIWLGGATPSLTRSALMFACWGIFLFIRKKHVLLDGLFWALLIMLILNPLALYDLRLQLSASAVLAIAITAPFAMEAANFLTNKLSIFLKHTKGNSPAPSAASAPSHNTAYVFLANIAKKVAKAAIAMLIISLGIQIVILPLQVYIFGKATPFFIFNLIWLPILSVFVFPLSIIALIFAVVPNLTFVASALFSLAAAPANLLFSLLAFMDEKNILVAPAVARPHPASTLAFWSTLACLVIIVAGITVRRKQGPSQLSSAKPFRHYFFSLASDLKNFLKLHFVISPTLKRGQAHLALTLALAWCLVGYSLYNRWSMEHPTHASMHVLDVGQGQALLFEGLNGERMLLDGGGAFNLDMGKYILAPEITFNRPPHIELVVNTHPDSDHLNGLFYILENFKVDYAYFGPAMPSGDAAKRLERALIRQNIPPLHLKKGDVLPFDSKHYFEVLYPPPILSKKRPTHNDYSLVMRFMEKTGEDASKDIPLALACGDVSKYGIELITGKRGREKNGDSGENGKEPTFEPSSLMAKVLILPHHGSKNNYTPQFYTEVAPKLAIASSGYNNAWGFPSQVVVDELKKQNIPLLTTAIYGQIVVTWNNSGEPSLAFARPQNKLLRQGFLKPALITEIAE